MNSQQQEKLSDEQIHWLIHRDMDPERIDESVSFLQIRDNSQKDLSRFRFVIDNKKEFDELLHFIPSGRIRHVCIAYEMHKKDFRDFVDALYQVGGLESLKVLRGLESDTECWAKLLENVKSLSVRDFFPCEELVQAMKVNSPNSVLQELDTGFNWSLIQAAASLHSVQSLTLHVNAIQADKLANSLAAVLGPGDCNIWDLGIDVSVKADDMSDYDDAHAFEEWTNGGFRRLLLDCNLKSLRLYDLKLSCGFLEVVATEDLSCKLQHLMLMLFDSQTLLTNTLARQNWDTLTSLDVQTNNPLLTPLPHNITHYTHRLAYKSHSRLSGTKLVELLDGSRLRHLLLEPKGISLDDDDERKLVVYLESNNSFSLETLEGLRWKDESLKQHCFEILNRNKVYREGGLLDKEQIPPSTAKLFICGDAGVGKSTLSKNLTRRIGIPACFQLTKSTYGIRLEALKFGARTLVLCDLAGQPEFHTFHHYFMRGSDKDLFLLVCRAPSWNEDPGMLENQLRYWLRFIVAHRSLSEHKPRVLILLNYFPESERPQDESKHYPYLRCEQVIQEYSDYINFGNPPDIFGLNVKDFWSVQRLKPALSLALTGLIENRPRVPELCKHIVQSMNSGPRPKVRSVEQFKSLYMKRSLTGKHLKACIMYLHDTGEVVYLEEEDETKDESKQFVIVDVQWFLRDLIGIFLPRLDRKSMRNHPHATRPMSAVKAAIGTKCEEEHVDYLFSCLHKLGITLRDDSDKVTILPLMQDRLGQWRQETGVNSYTFWGRRFDCKDSARTLLPFGIFNMLQVRLAGMFSRTSIGKGWLYLVENRIHVIVKIGGIRNEWYDKHWIDVLVRIPFYPDDFLLETGQMLFQQVKTCLFQLCGATNWGCPSLELEEKVIGARSVEHDPDAIFQNVHKLSRVLEKLKAGGMLYNYTWPVEETTPAFQLLLPSERDAYFCEQEDAMKETLMEVEECLWPIESQTKPHQHVETDENDSEESELSFGEKKMLMKLNSTYRQVKKSESHIVREVKASEQHIINEIHRLELVVKKQMEVIHLQGMNILSKLQLNLEFEAPKYPLLTDDNNCLQRISSLTFGSTSRLHFLCEYSEGCHPVENQRGIQMQASPKWFKKAAPVLIPTLRILFFTLKIVAVAGFGVILPSPHSAFPKGLEVKAIDAVCEKIFENVDKHLISKVPSKDDMQEFHASLNEFLKGKNLGEELGLYRATQNGQPAWLCQRHRSSSS